ncbi:hypothetical protein PSH79_12180 [Pseudomonas sp. FP2196]|uniref:hypothetical protein n=1 Tax=Pseudomonas sp. FP2196 TaxID=2954086 RepID=UPI0027340A60|nr:hypothetical protein [Pseudomonas sp. FP2196]WLH38014.1 hypothetical protein PSH79_12180 [Pseudomonas sp. FP2196]
MAARLGHGVRNLSINGDFSDFPPALMLADELDPLRDDTLKMRSGSQQRRNQVAKKPGG